MGKQTVCAAIGQALLATNISGKKSRLQLQDGPPGFPYISEEHPLQALKNLNVKVKLAQVWPS